MFQRTKEIYTFKENGYFLITDQYDLNRVRFLSAEERQTWIDGFELATGKKAIVISREPDVVDNLRRLNVHSK